MFTSERHINSTLVTVVLAVLLAASLPALHAPSGKASADESATSNGLIPDDLVELNGNDNGNHTNENTGTEPLELAPKLAVEEANSQKSLADNAPQVMEEELGIDPDTNWIDNEVGLGDEFISESSDADLSHDIPLLQSTGTWLWRGHWYTEQSMVAMYRTPPNGKILTRDPTFTRIIMQLGQSPTIQPRDNQDPLESDGQTFRAETGVKLTIGNIIGRDQYNRDHAIEFTFFGLFDFGASDTITAAQGPGNEDPDSFVLDLGNNVFLLDGLLLDGEVGPTSGIFNLPISIVGFSNARTHSYSYISDFNSYELNLRRRSRLRRDRLLLQPNGSWHRDINSGRLLTLLGGMRMLRHNEHFRWTSSGAIDEQLTRTSSGRFETSVHNDMFGPQLGAGIVEQRAHWNWGVKSTAGLLYNFADRDVSIETNDPTAVVNPNNHRVADYASDDQAVFMWEAGAHVGYHIRPNITLKASYDVLFYTGIAVARDAIEINGVGFQQDSSVFGPGQVADTFRPLELRNDALYHAFSLGVELVW